VLSNKDFIAKTKNSFIQAFRNCPNVFTQHTSFVSGIVSKLISKKTNSDIVTINPSNKEK